MLWWRIGAALAETSALGGWAGSTSSVLFANHLSSRNQRSMEFVYHPAGPRDGPMERVPFSQWRTPPPRTKHFESPHHSKKWRLDLADESRLGLAPPMWSTTSQMNDPRPLGVSLFDARFRHHAMGRARSGRNIAWDPRGTTHAGATQKAQNMDAVAAASANAEMTNKSAQSAYYAEYFDGINTIGDDGANAQADLMIAQMSKLQRRQLDKDGDVRAGTLASSFAHPCSTAALAHPITGTFFCRAVRRALRSVARAPCCLTD